MLVTGSAVLVLANSVVKLTVFSLPLASERVGKRGSDILIIPCPSDSLEFNIPSLSLSKSRLSMISSPSKSVGHILIGISVD